MAQSQVQYAVNGTYAGNGKRVYLIDELTEKKIDSVVVADGKFAFSGTADKDALMAVKVNKNHWTTQFFSTPVLVQHGRNVAFVSLAHFHKSLN